MCVYFFHFFFNCKEMTGFRVPGKVVCGIMLQKVESAFLPDWIRWCWWKGVLADSACEW